MPSDGAVAVGPRRSDGMGNELKESGGREGCGTRRSGRNKEDKRRKNGGMEVMKGRCVKRARRSFIDFILLTVLTPQPCYLYRVPPLLSPFILFSTLDVFKATLISEMLHRQNTEDAD